MTVFIRDASDYDADPISLAGLAGLTHKATEGTRPYADTMGTKLAARLTAARAAGVPVLGSYHVVRTPGNGGAGMLTQQLTHWVSYLDSQVPWWRTWPHWVMQVDAEMWPYDAVTAGTVMQFVALLAGSGLPGWKVTYASRGQYGDSLRGIVTPLWNADYRGGGSYPGDTWMSSNGQAAGWANYSDRTPALLQFNGGPDLSAFRGSIADLLRLTSGRRDDMLLIAHVKLSSGTESWYVGDGVHRRTVIDWPEHEGLIAAGAIERSFVDEWSAFGYVGRVDASAPTVAAPLALSDADRQTIVDGVAAQVGSKLDEVLRRLAAAGDALNG